MYNKVESVYAVEMFHLIDKIIIIGMSVTKNSNDKRGCPIKGNLFFNLSNLIRIDFDF